MKKEIIYNNQKYIVEKNEDEVVTIKKDINGTYTDVSGNELEEFLKYINATTIKEEKQDEYTSLRVEILKKIDNGEIKTTDDIDTLLTKSTLTNEEKENLKNETIMILTNNTQKDINIEELDKYCTQIKNEIEKPRTESEYIFSEFNVINGTIKHTLYYTDTKTGEKKIILEKDLDYNQAVIDHIIDQSIKDMATYTEHVSSEYEIKTNILGDTANYSLSGTHNCYVKVNDISVDHARSLKEEVDKINPVINSEYNEQKLSNNENNTNARQKEEILQRVRKKPQNTGFMNLKFVIALIIILGIALILLTKFVLLK